MLGQGIHVKHPLAGWGVKNLLLKSSLID